GRIRLRLDWRGAGKRVKERRAETVNIAAQVLGMSVQAFRSDVIRRAPNLRTRLRTLRRDGSQAKVADLGRVLVGEKNVRRFNVAVDETFRVRGAQTFRNLDPGLQHTLFGK